MPVVATDTRQNLTVIYPMSVIAIAAAAATEAGSLTLRPRSSVLGVVQFF